MIVLFSFFCNLVEFEKEITDKAFSRLDMDRRRQAGSNKVTSPHSTMKSGSTSVKSSSSSGNSGNSTDGDAIDVWHAIETAKARAVVVAENGSRNGDRFQECDGQLSKTETESEAKDQRRKSQEQLLRTIKSSPAQRSNNVVRNFTEKYDASQKENTSMLSTAFAGEGEYSGLSDLVELQLLAHMGENDPNSADLPEMDSHFERTYTRPIPLDLGTRAPPAVVEKVKKEKPAGRRSMMNVNVRGSIRNFNFLKMQKHVAEGLEGDKRSGSGSLSPGGGGGGGGKAQNYRVTPASGSNPTTTTPPSIEKKGLPPLNVDAVLVNSRNSSGDDASGEPQLGELEPQMKGQVKGEPQQGQVKEEVKRDVRRFFGISETGDHTATSATSATHTSTSTSTSTPTSTSGVTPPLGSYPPTVTAAAAAVAGATGVDVLHLVQEQQAQLAAKVDHQQHTLDAIMRTVAQLAAASGI